MAFRSNCRNGEDLIFILNLPAGGARRVAASVPMYTDFVTRGSQAKSSEIVTVIR